MKQEAFEARYERRWRRLERLIRALDAGRRRGARDPGLERVTAEFPDAYREVCHHLALARARRYSPHLRHRLNRLALDGHRHLYARRSRPFGALARFFAADFPNAFRRHWRYMLVSALVLFLPLAALIAAIAERPDLVFTVLPAEEVIAMEEMYDPDNRVLGRERESASDLEMFGYYIYNNVGIGFRTFAGGLLFGVGSLLVLSMNGVVIGAVAGHLTRIGHTDTFWPFVIGHGAFELTAIVIFGGAGLMLGLAAWSPGRRARWDAIRARALETLPLVYGGAAMLLIAAFVEAYWSSMAWPPPATKYGVGATLWLLVALYLGFAGSRRRAA